MVLVKMLYVIEKTVNGKLYRYWQPKKRYFVGAEWKECPFKRLRLPDADWHAKAVELNVQLEKWRKGYITHKSPEGSIGELIAQYRKSAKFRKLGPNTQKLYIHYLEVLRKEVGEFQVKDFGRKEAMFLYEEMATNHARGASQFVQVSRVLFEYGIKIESADKNPFMKMDIPKDAPRQTIIPVEFIESAKAKAIELGLRSVAVAIQLGYDTAQRPGDIRNLSRKDYDGQWLRIKQAKTNARVDIPVFRLPVLKAMLDAQAHDSVLILHEERTGQPYTKDMLCRRVREVYTACGIGKDMQFRDLRRTSVVRLAEAGCEIGEICSITGHSLKEATRILEIYMPRSRKQAENAVIKLEKVGKTC